MRRITVAVRSADCQRGHRAAGPLRAHLDPQPAGTARETSVSAGNLDSPVRSPSRSASTSTTTPACSSPSGSSCAASTCKPWQQARVLKDYVLDFPEFREITFFGAGGRVIATSRAGRRDAVHSGCGQRRQRRHLHRAAPARRGQSAPHDDCRPRHARRPGSRLGRRRDRARGALAHGRSHSRRPRGLRAARRRRAAAHRTRQSQQEARLSPRANAPGAPKRRAGLRGRAARRARTERGITDELLRRATAARCSPSAPPCRKLPWVVIVEQPTDEAFALAHRLAAPVARRHRPRAARHGHPRAGSGAAPSSRASSR